MGERGRELDLQPSAGAMPADRLIAPGLVLLPVSGQEHTGRLPPLPPLGLGQAPAGEAAAPTQQGLPAPTTDTVPAFSCRSTLARRACSDWSRTALACRSAAVAYPRIVPYLLPAWIASRASSRRIRACRLVPSARRFCSASRTWSSLVRVIAPAHRDDDSAVKARFRTARDEASPFATSRPSAHRA